MEEACLLQVRSGVWISCVCDNPPWWRMSCHTAHTGRTLVLLHTAARKGYS